MNTEDVTQEQPLHDGMNDVELAHLAGVVEGGATITAKVNKNSKYRIGFQAAVLIRFQQAGDDSILMGKFLAYCDEYGVTVDRREREMDSGRSRHIAEIIHQDSVRKFLEPLLPYLTERYEQVTLILEELLPRLEDGQHTSKQGLYDLMPLVEQIRRSNQLQRDYKYDQEYFAEEWGDDIET